MSKSKFSHVRIAGIAGVVPEKRIDIDDEVGFYRDATHLLRNKKILGLGSRYVVSGTETAVDMCEQAATKLIAGLDIDRSSIDAVVFCSVSPDYISPASSQILQGRLGLPETCFCFDMSGGCTGSVNALQVVHSLVESGVCKRGLLLVGDMPSRAADIRNRNTVMLFSDMAVAVLVERSESVVESYFNVGTRGDEWKNLVIPAGGAKLPIRADIVSDEVVDSSGNVWHLWDSIMKGMPVFKFATQVVPKSIVELLEFAHMTVEQMDCFALHQANRQIVLNIARYVDIPLEKVPVETFTKYANGSTASVLSVVVDQVRAGMTHVFLCAFGTGLSYGTSILDVSKMKNLGFSVYENHADEQTREELIKEWKDFYLNGSAES